MSSTAPSSGRRPRVAGLILAAGQSSRMRLGSKLLLPFGPGTVIDSVTQAAAAAGLSPVVAVIGHDAELLEPVLRDSPARPVVHPGYARGPFSSLHAGLRALASERLDAVAVLLADEPGIQVSAIRAVVRAWTSSRLLVRARYTDRPGHPVVFSPHTVRIDLDLGSGRSVWEALCLTGHRKAEVPVNIRAPIDIDDAEAYERALARRQTPC